MLHWRKAPSRLRGAKEGLQGSAPHTKWELPFVRHQRSSRPGALAAQRLGDNPAPVKAWADGAKYCRVCRKKSRGRSVRSKTCQSVTHSYTSRWVPPARAGPGNQVQSCSFPLPPAPQHKEVLHSVALPPGAVNPELGLQKPPGSRRASEWRSGSQAPPVLWPEALKAHAAQSPVAFPSLPSILSTRCHPLFMTRGLKRFNLAQSAVTTEVPELFL